MWPRLAVYLTFVALAMCFAAKVSYGNKMLMPRWVPLLCISTGVIVMIAVIAAYFDHQDFFVKSIKRPLPTLRQQYLPSLAGVAITGFSVSLVFTFVGMALTANDIDPGQGSLLFFFVNGLIEYPFKGMLAFTAGWLVLYGLLYAVEGDVLRRRQGD